MKYILFEKSAVELMINNPALQSMEFPASEKFVNFLREKSDDFLLKDICNGVQREHNKNLIMDCQSYTKYRPNETTGGIFVSWRRKEELPTGA